MKIPSPSHNKKPRIEIIPFIDIMFFLLATFMMVSLSMIQNQGIPVNLPVATSATPEKRQESATVTISQTGEFYLNKEPLSQEAIIEKLRALKSASPDFRVFINGDREANFGDAVGILDEIRKAGITKVAIQTKPQD
ncbi:biopolymer transporter ExbD [Oscillatoria laete-virens NRMC-F 0139]|nr:biopolymer transporter ExbD [Oscillatoria laete-virens]MDL5054765.1 biopolymer transporter ExbD [Oscillatoria laete-virens NRMC-F 0139]